MFGLYDELVIFDHVDKTIKVVANADLKPFMAIRSRPIRTPAGGSTTSCSDCSSRRIRRWARSIAGGPPMLQF